jgi:hypothetical protein
LPKERSASSKFHDGHVSDGVLNRHTVEHDGNVSWRLSHSAFPRLLVHCGKASYADTGAHGVRVENDDKVYFPFSVAEALELEQFDEVEATLIQNARADPPWKALRARRVDKAQNN